MKITIDKAVVEQALEALYVSDIPWLRRVAEEAITTLRAALEVNETNLPDCVTYGEPVPWEHYSNALIEIAKLNAKLNEAKEVEPVAVRWRPNGKWGWSYSTKELVKDLEGFETEELYLHPAPAVPVDQCAECKSLGKTSAAMCKQCERDTPVLQVLVKSMLATALEVKK